LGYRVRLGGITDISTVDWYGNVSSVVFFAGCNFRCPYCQNSSLIPVDSGLEVAPDILRQRIETNLGLLDSVVFTGGEPLLQKDALMEAARVVKNYHLKLMLDTNGSLPDTVNGLLDAHLVHRVALDVKAPLTAEDYGRVINLPLLGAEMIEAVEETIEICNSHGVEIEARTTVVPTLSDEPEFIQRIASSLRGRCKVFYLQQFDNTGDILDQRFKKLKPPTREQMVELAEVALGEGLDGVYIKTRKLGLERMG